MDFHLCNNKRDFLPFFTVAITILIEVSAYTVMMHNTDRTAESAKKTEDGTDVVETAISNIKTLWTPA